MVCLLHIANLKLTFCSYLKSFGLGFTCFACLADSALIATASPLTVSTASKISPKS